MTAIEPDTKDWTWVLSEPCPDCGFVADAVRREDFGAQIRTNAASFALALATRGADIRRRSDAWSVTEYGCHLVDVHLIFERRVRSMLDQDNPLFDNWDQDESAMDGHYDQQRGVEVAPTLLKAAEAAAAAYESVPNDAWDRPGRRSNGSTFTVDSIGRYHLHDIVHHLWDIGSAVTLAAYEAGAAAYRTGISPRAATTDAAIASLAAEVGPGASVLEIGSGGGQDAEALEANGLSVRRTDVTEAFVERPRADGHRADLVDPFLDELGGPYDAIWANASLLHTPRVEIPVVLAKLAAATRPGGALYFSVKAGDGDGWSQHGSIELPRLFVYWREPALRSLLDEAGWEVMTIDEEISTFRNQPWLSGFARRR